MKKTLCLSFLFLIAVGFASVAGAQDPTTAAADVYKELFENDRVRVLEVNVKPDQKIQTHSHPAHVAYTVTPCTLTITPANGKAETATLKAGDVVWFDAVTHTGHNTGTADCRVVVVELKETK